MANIIQASWEVKFWKRKHFPVFKFTNLLPLCLWLAWQQPPQSIAACLREMLNEWDQSTETGSESHTLGRMAFVSIFYIYINSMSLETMCAVSIRIDRWALVLDCFLNRWNWLALMYWRYWDIFKMTADKWAQDLLQKATPYKKIHYSNLVFVLCVSGFSCSWKNESKWKWQGQTGKWIH